MKSFSDYISKDEIVNSLCRIRIRHAKKLHKIHLIRDVSAYSKTNKIVDENYKVPIELSSILPSRRSWVHPGYKSRVALKNSQEINLVSLRKTINKTQQRVNNGALEPQWFSELGKIICIIQNQINGLIQFKIRDPEIIPKRKEKNKNSPECRPICSYNLIDRIIIGITAKYLTDFFDEYFHDCSYAFRSTKGNKQRKTHHDAIKAINNYRQERKGKELWVSECDIKKFFDSISHQIIIKVYEELKTKAFSDGKEFDKRADKIFYEYLKSYSFNHSVFELNKTDYFSQKKIQNGYFGWIEDELKEAGFYDNIEDSKIGIPQGGAISCFIANLVMHKVDESIMGNNIDRDLLYIRFCDDMVIIHTEEKKCEEAFKKYVSELRRFKLITHEPTVINYYDKSFWINPNGKEVKSKSPYRWSKKSNNIRNVPWLAFVGYQIRYDGAIRIRKKSLEKELRKQKEETEHIINALNVSSKVDLEQNSRKSKAQQIFALKCRLISMAVGRQNILNIKNHIPNFCWLAGFNALNDNPVTRSQLRKLDRNRDRLLNQFRLKIRSLNKKTSNPELSRPIERFHGFPYSYFSLLKNNR